MSSKPMTEARSEAVLPQIRLSPSHLLSPQQMPSELSQQTMRKHLAPQRLQMPAADQSKFNSQHLKISGKSISVGKEESNEMTTQ